MKRCDEDGDVAKGKEGEAVETPIGIIPDYKVDIEEREKRREEEKRGATVNECFFKKV